MITKTKNSVSGISINNIIEKLTGELFQNVSKTFNKKDEKIYDVLYAQIQVTNDYSKFSFSDSNRNIKETHVRKLIRLFNLKLLDLPVIVDENMTILDRQHTFLARMSLGKPILYYISKNITDDDVPMLNSNSRSWAWFDYSKHFIKKMNINYIKYKLLWNRYNGDRKDKEPGKFNYRRIINHNELSMLILGYTSFTTKVKDVFYGGKLVFNRSEKEITDSLDFLFDVVIQFLTIDLISKRDFQTGYFTMFYHPNFNKDLFLVLIKRNKSLYNSVDFQNYPRGVMKKTLINNYNDLVSSDFEKLTY